MIIFWVLGFTLAQEPGCDYERCIDTRFGPFKTTLSCGKVVSEDPVNGKDKSYRMIDWCKNVTVSN